MTSMTSANLEEREAAFEALRNDADALRAAEFVRLAAEKDAVRARHDADIRSAEEALKARAEELDRLLARDIVATINPIVGRFAKAPRDTAAELATAWRSLNARAAAELGETIATEIILVAFAKTFGEVEAARIGSPKIDLGHDWSLHRTLDPRNGPAAVEAGLRACEIAVERAVSANIEPDAERAEVMQRYATTGRRAAALRAYDLEVEAARLEAARPAEERRASEWRGKHEKNLDRLINLRRQQADRPRVASHSR